MPRSEPFYPPRTEDINFADTSQFPWPKKGQKLFQEPNSSGREEARIVVQWVEKFKDSEFLGDAFKDAGDQLIEAVLQGGDGGHPDRFVYPSVYLYRHAAELQLKHLADLCFRLDYLAESSKVDEALSNHNLYSLWNVVSTGLKVAQPNGGDELGIVEARISELHRVDPSGQHMRYASTKSGEKIQLNLPEEIDLENLRSVFDGFWAFLQACGYMLDEHLEWKHECEREMAAEFGGEYGP